MFSVRNKLVNTKKCETIKDDIHTVSENKIETCCNTFCSNLIASVFES